jgi:hypothetical protein
VCSSFCPLISIPSVGERVRFCGVLRADDPLLHDVLRLLSSSLNGPLGVALCNGTRGGRENGPPGVSDGEGLI